MNSLQASILEHYESAQSDDELIQQLNTLATANGDDVYPAIFSILSSLDLDPVDAKKHWTNLLAHHKQLKNDLGREVNLTTAMNDYLCSQTNILTKPKIIDSNAYAKAVQESTHDSLTGLFNKAYFCRSLEQQISSAGRQHTDVSVLFLDVDDFKEVNDTFGHQAGDMVLSAIADKIQGQTRGSDIVARYGGEEFVVLMPHTDSVNALVIADRIREKIASQEIILGGKPYHITLSGGIATYPVHALTAKDLLNLADSSLYRAKGAGKNNISLFKEDKRRFLRIKFNRQIELKELGFNDSQSFSAVSKDIGIGGVLFENDKAIPIGTKIQVNVPITNKEPILLIGTVVRIEAFAQDVYDIGMTISFKEMERTAKNEISKFLVKQSKNA